MMVPIRLVLPIRTLVLTRDVEILGNIYGDLEIIKGLDFISRLGVDFIYADNSFLLKAHEMGDAGGVGETSLDITNRNLHQSDS